MTTPRSRVTRCVRRQLLRSSVARHICSWKEAQHVTVRTVAQLICIAVTNIPSFHVDPAEWIKVRRRESLAPLVRFLPMPGPLKYTYHPPTLGLPAHQDINYLRAVPKVGTVISQDHDSSHPLEKPAHDTSYTSQTRQDDPPAFPFSALKPSQLLPPLPTVP